MGLLSRMGDSFGCSATGERLVTAARDGDVQETRAILEFNPGLARYAKFGVGNSPLHYSAARGHHEVVSLLIESGVDMNLRNSRGQSALMLSCIYGHWKVVQMLILFKASIHKRDCSSGATALHFAALYGHTHCIRLLLADYVPSMLNFWSTMQGVSTGELDEAGFDPASLRKVVNRKADGGITALHLAALHGHAESVKLLLDLGASVLETTVNDGSTIDLIGAGSTPLHYAACGGSAACCQLLLARGALLTARNANGWTPLMVARSWHKTDVESVLSREPQSRTQVLPSPYLSLPLMSVIRIAREFGWRTTPSVPDRGDPCAICLETGCTVAAEGCNHEFCTGCALHLCSTGNSSVSAAGAPGSIPCPLCRHPIVSFMPLTSTTPVKELLPWRRSAAPPYSSVAAVQPYCYGSQARFSSPVQLGCSSFRLPRLRTTICSGADETTPCLVRCLKPEKGRKSSTFRESSRRRSIMASV